MISTGLSQTDIDVGQLPNFLVIGAGKSGTTSLYYYLKQHPQIYMSPVKEPKFFALKGHPLDYNGPGDKKVLQGTTVTLKEYTALFKEVNQELAVGEASTIYLNDEKTAENIYSFIPNVKIVAILRHPAERAYSAYMHLRRDGREPLASFQAALDEEKNRVSKGYYYHWHYQERGYYYKQLKGYYRYFHSDQIKIFLYEDFNINPYAVLREIYEFLNVDPEFIADISVRHNQSGMPRNRWLQSFLIKSNPFKEYLKRLIPENIGHQLIYKIQSQNVHRSTLSPELKSQLTDIYREDIMQLQNLIQRDLSAWLKQ